jgi:uncharacterized protein YecE (DUF72 family)
MNQKSSLREVPQFVSWVLTGNTKRISSWKSQGCDVFVFFDNDQKSAAPMDALKLKQILLPKR